MHTRAYRNMPTKQYQNFLSQQDRPDVNYPLECLDHQESIQVLCFSPIENGYIRGLLEFIYQKS